MLNPQWDKSNRLYAVSDRDNWWKIYRVDQDRFAAVESGLEQAEIGGPDWSIEENYYYLLDEGKIAAKLVKGGVESLVIIDPATASARPLALASASIGDFLPVADRFLISAAADAPRCCWKPTLPARSRP